MKSQEKFITPSSDYYNYAPSVDAQHTFFYPISTGHFTYEPGYSQQRNSFDSFLLMYIQNGKLEVTFNGQMQIVRKGNFVLLDCYSPHGYQTNNGWECIWIHFDGPVSRSYYEMVVSRLGNIFNIDNPLPALTKMTQIYDTFSEGKTIREAMLSKQICDILTSFLLFTPLQSRSSSTSVSMEKVVTYINEHFKEELSIEYLATIAGLSPYHFIRMFKKEIGFTPHEYLLNTRLSNAKYMLKNSTMSIKDICYNTGFSSESVFCTSFKKNVGSTPVAYRNEKI